MQLVEPGSSVKVGEGTEVHIFSVFRRKRDYPVVDNLKIVNGTEYNIRLNSWAGKGR
jgi:hypothetical protein